MEFASTGTVLSVCETENGTFLPMYGFFTTPDMGKENERIDVTNYSDRVERKIDSGVKSFDSLTFDAYINIKQSTESETTQILESYKYLRQKQEAGTKLWFKLTYPDGGTHTWKGTPNAWRLATNIKEALKFRLSATVESSMTETYGSISEQSSSSAST
jgi:hypothetical protein